MSAAERKYKGSLSLGKLEVACEAEEQAFGEIAKLEAVGGMTVATYDDGAFPTLNSLAMLPMIGEMEPPSPAHATHLFDGRVTVLGVALDVSVFRST